MLLLLVSVMQIASRVPFVFCFYPARSYAAHAEMKIKTPASLCSMMFCSLSVHPLLTLIETEKEVMILDELVDFGESYHQT
ncbi:uncharacterized protein BDR25DRAFT_126286 [Lindgomyces ingoldianus]|uniref:Uncharacterized protein n=1 Tax=Lindgomyces ingoldianus TaxID=673940 RepID=A0ACB6R433_9PLEO|nr:uncharacterized protein BDR25DRAFT_126286 [Lindgomyces ingoldianus]KAF2473941.1 hypothetical protein BDR25DRAFT_126286 [Lindgomyces ingoldianus]